MRLTKTDNRQPFFTIYIYYKYKRSLCPVLEELNPVMQSGRTSIRLSNASAYLPDIDKISVDVNDVTVSTLSNLAFNVRNNFKLTLVKDNLLIDGTGVVIRTYICDMAGKVCLISEKTRIIPVHSLRSGIYAVKVITKDGSISKVFLKSNNI